MDAGTRAPDPVSGPPLVPPCPKCHRIDKAEEEKRADPSTHWFVCSRCNTHYVAPPRFHP